MAWCPKCKNEYREGFTVCAECKVALVDSLEKVMIPLMFGKSEKLSYLKDFLEYNGLTNVEMRYDETEEVYEILIQEKDKNQAANLTKVFLMKQTEMMQEKAKASNETTVDEEEVKEEDVLKIRHAAIKEERKPSNGRYQSSADKAEDNKSSAWTLLGLGFLGLTFIVLGILGVIPISFGNPYIFYGVMGGIFGLFVVMGFVSMKSAKEYSKQAASEKDEQKEVLDWCKENFKPDVIDGELYMQDVPEEVLYFRRYEKMKQMLMAQFPNMDVAFIEQFIDETVYDMVFSE